MEADLSPPEAELFPADTLNMRLSELAALQAEISRLGQQASLDDLQLHLVERASRLVDSETAALVLLDEMHDGWIICKSISNQAGWVYQAGSMDGPGLVKECLRTGLVNWSNDIRANPHFDPAFDGVGKLEIRSMLCAPLVMGGHTFGAIQVVNRRSGKYDQTDAEHLSLVAILAANAIHNIRAFQELKVITADLEASRSELLSSRNMLRALFDNLPLGLYIIDLDYQLAAINKGRAQRTGQTPQGLIGQHCYQALYQRDTPCPECRVRETLWNARLTRRSERRSGAQSSTEETTEWEISTFPILDDKDLVTQAILLEVDVTERRRLETILTQSEKLAAVGQLAAGVAHEINNPLTAIIANAQILRRELPVNSDLQESVDLIARAGARAAQVVRNLLDFARKEEYHLGLTDLNETVERALELVQHELLAHSVRLHYDPDPSLPLILASQDHLQSVWLNLLLNAIDSMDKAPAEVHVTTRRVGDEIQVAVSDNGKGISPERLRRIFEPFYTTKAPGRGTGLGLSVSHRIVKQHSGAIRVESQAGSGSTFTVVLPAV